MSNSNNEQIHLPNTDKQARTFETVKNSMGNFDKQLVCPFLVPKEEPSTPYVV